MENIEKIKVIETTTNEIREEIVNLGQKLTCKKELLNEIQQKCNHDIVILLAKNHLNINYPNKLHVCAICGKVNNEMITDDCFNNKLGNLSQKIVIDASNYTNDCFLNIFKDNSVALAKTEELKAIIFNVLEEYSDVSNEDLRLIIEEEIPKRKIKVKSRYSN